MSSSLFELIAESSDPLAILEIANARYELIAQGPGPIRCQAAPGLYVVRAKSLERVEEKLVRLRDAPQTVRFQAQPTLEERSTRHSEATLGAQVNASRTGEQTHWISIAIKPDRSQHQPYSRSPLKAADFQVCRLDGSQANAFQAGTAEHAPLDPNSIGEAASIDLAPGWYAMSMPGGHGARVLLPLFVAWGFSPTVFVETRSNRDEQWIDYDRLLVSYDAREVNSYTDPMRMYAIEMARRSLELGRNTLTKPLMDILLQQKFQDPTLGLLAMQLLLLGAHPMERQAETMFNVVSNNMANAFGTAAHPDLVLARELARRKAWHVPFADGDGEPLMAPPLLRANWNAMVHLPARSKELGKRSGALYAVGQSLIRAGVWVVWKPAIHAVQRPWPSAPALEVESDLAQIGGRSASSAGTASDSPRKRIQPSTPRVARVTRKPDDQLEESVDLVRSQTYLHDALRDSVAAEPALGTVLDRMVARTVLQLAGFEFGNDKNVPTGYAKQMAQSLDVPMPLVRDSIARVHTALHNRVLQGEKTEPGARIELDPIK